MNFIHTTLDVLKEKYAFIKQTSTFRQTGQITPEEFVAAGDYLVYKFPSWSWADASPPSKRAAHLPPGKQFLITRGVPCHRRLNDDFAGDAGREETIVRDGFDGKGSGKDGDAEDDEGWLRTGGLDKSQEARLRDVRTVDEAGNVGDREPDDDDEIPDMEDEDDDDEAIIRDPKAGSGTTAAPRTYTLYITYSPYYQTPRLFLSGYLSPSEPLPPHLMMEDIVGDYKDKTVTLEDFPYYDHSVKMASVHPCKHASVMKVLLDRADAALKLRLAKMKAGQVQTSSSSSAAPKTGMEGLIDDTDVKLSLQDKPPSGTATSGHAAGVAAAGGNAGDEWEVLDEEAAASKRDEEQQQVAIRVDQYLVVFLKFMASVTPGIEHDFTMGV